MSSKITELLLVENSKKQWKKTANWILKNDKLEDLLLLFLSDNSRLSQRASGVFMTIVDVDKNVFLPYQQQLVAFLTQQPTTAQKRNIFRLFQFIFIKEEVEGILLDQCFITLENVNEPIAVRAFAMTVAYRIGERYPEIFPELKQLIELNFEIASSTGLVNRGSKILKKIQKFT